VVLNGACTPWDSSNLRQAQTIRVSATCHSHRCALLCLGYSGFGLTVGSFGCTDKVLVAAFTVLLCHLTPAAGPVLCCNNRSLPLPPLQECHCKPGEVLFGCAKPINSYLAPAIIFH
jgi:hypothetical protein